MIECRGRNGWFNYHESSTDCFEGSGGLSSGWRAWVWIYSKSPHTKTAPIQITGDPKPIIQLLRKIARELEADYRAAKKARKK